MDSHNRGGIMPNEDYLTWPNVDYTCTFCRKAAVIGQIGREPQLRAALVDSETGDLIPEEWETQQAVDNFLVHGEGRLAEIFDLAREKHWLRKNTKIAELMQQAMASSKFIAREQDRYDGIESDDDIYTDDEDDPEWMGATEDSAGVKELALGDWARTRILDGFWIAPADIWYNRGPPFQVPRAHHPCPWAEEKVKNNPFILAAEAVHPHPRISASHIPPTYNLCERAHRAYQKAVREILLPAMSNIVRRLVLECATAVDGAPIHLSDPCTRASRLSINEIVCLLREESVWFTGVNWARRLQHEKERSDSDEHRSHLGPSEHESTSAVSSPAESSTSPVLSTTTIQTTPSPPPIEPSKTPAQRPSKGKEKASAFPIPVSPVLETPVLLHSIPYIPETLSTLPQFAQDVFKQVSTSACSFYCTN